MCALVSLLTDKFILQRIIILKLIRLLFLSVVATGFGFLTSPLKAQFAFVLAGDESGFSSVWAYHIETTGTLTLVAGSPLPVGASFTGALALDQKGKYLYVTDPDDGLVWGFTVDTTGAVISMPGPPAYTHGLEPFPITLEPTGKFAYVVNTNVSACFGTSPPTIAAYRIGPKGKLQDVPGSPFLAGNASGPPVVDQTSRFLYLADGIDNDIAGFRINSEGALAPIAGSPFGAGLAPLLIAMDPRGKFLYEFARSLSGVANVIAVYKIDDAGVLVPIPGSPFIYFPGLNPLSAAVAPIVQMVYLANLGSANISAYSIEAQGLLKQITGSPFPSTSSPTIIAAEPKNGFVYVASFYSRSIFGYGVGKDGVLTLVPTSPFPTGFSPSAIAIKAP
jgi:6-phosphogluconolactonase (cycloisomerase 2 family)